MRMTVEEEEEELKRWKGDEEEEGLGDCTI